MHDITNTENRLPPRSALLGQKLQTEIQEGLFLVERHRLLVAGRGGIGKGEDQRARRVWRGVLGFVDIVTMDVTVENRDVLVGGEDVAHSISIARGPLPTGTEIEQR